MADLPNQTRLPSGAPIQWRADTVPSSSGTGNVLSSLTMNINGQDVSLNFVASKTPNHFITLSHQSRITDIVKTNNTEQAARAVTEITQSPEFKAEMQRRGVAPATYFAHTDPAGFQVNRLGASRPAARGPGH